MHVDFFKHSLGSEEKQAVALSLNDPFLTTGKTVERFENLFSDYIGCSFSLGVTSCTHAMELALRALEIGPGDEVITTPQTFVATTLAVLAVGATPVWVDVETTTGNIDIANVEKAITKCTKAILPVHLYGNMCDIRSISKLAKKYNLMVIEDAAHALESKRDGICVGELSDCACFSFYTTKSITCGEGGAVTTNNQELYKKMKILRSHGIDRDAFTRYGTTSSFDLSHVGMKCNMSNIQAAILIPQMKKIEENRDRRENVCSIYRKNLSGLKNVGLFPELSNNKSGCHLFPIFVLPHKRDLIRKKLKEAGIETAVNYRSINTLSVFLNLFNKGEGTYPKSEKIGDRCISLPLYPSMEKDKIDYVCEKLIEVLS